MVQREELWEVLLRGQAICPDQVSTHHMEILEVLRSVSEHREDSKNSLLRKCLDQVNTMMKIKIELGQMDLKYQ